MIILQSTANMLTCKLLMCLSLIFASSHLASSKSYHFDRFDGMCRGKKVPIRVAFNIIRQENSVIFLNATVNVTEDIDDDPLAVTKVSRCRSKEALDTCEHFITSSPVKYCNVINPKLASFSPFYINYTPPYFCPLKKNIYHAYNAKIDFKPILVFPLGDWFWKSVTDVLHTKTQKLLYRFQVDGYQSR